MAILKISEQLVKLSEEKLRLPVPVLPSDVGPCGACGNPDWNGQICKLCGYVSETELSALQMMQMQQEKAAKVARKTTCSNCGSRGQDGEECEGCGHPLPPDEFRDLDLDDKGIKGLELRPWDDGSKSKKPKSKRKKKGFAKDTLQEVQLDPTTIGNQAAESPADEDEETKQGATMSRFDDEFTREAAVPGVQYDQTSTLYLDGPFGLTQQAPAPQVEGWKDVYPSETRPWSDVRNLDQGDIIGGPGSNAVHAEESPFEQQPQPSPEVAGVPAAFEQPGWLPYNVDNNKGASVTYPGVEEDLYKVYEASRDLRKSIKNGQEINFDLLHDRLATVLSIYKAGTGRVANRSKIGEVKALKKVAESIENSFDLGTSGKAVREALKDFENRLATLSVFATNGNQETSTPDDVRNLDGTGNMLFDRQHTMTPDAQVNVLVPNLQPNQLALADVPDYYNDGGETGYGLAYNYHREPWPNDATNPALQGYMGLEYQTASKVAAVQDAREKILESIELVDRLERLGMVHTEDRAKHIAKFEQMSADQLEGFKQSVDMLEKTGARQPRSQKVASGSNRLPEMGRMTTATTSRQDVATDDFLLTLN